MLGDPWVYSLGFTDVCDRSGGKSSKQINQILHQSTFLLKRKWQSISLCKTAIGRWQILGSLTHKKTKLKARRHKALQQQNCSSLFPLNNDNVVTQNIQQPHPIRDRRRHSIKTRGLTALNLPNPLSKMLRILPRYPCTHCT